MYSSTPSCRPLRRSALVTTGTPGARIMPAKVEGLRGLDFGNQSLGRVGVDERVEALVHPRVAAFVRVDEHREPVVPDLVCRHLVEAALVAPAAEHDHRILHAAFDAVDVGRDGVGVAIEAVVVARIAARSIAETCATPSARRSSRPTAPGCRRRRSRPGRTASLEAQATVRTFSARNRQVSGPSPAGRLEGAMTSSSPRMITVSSLARACSRRARWSAV